MDKKVSIIIVSYNSAKFIDKCINAIRKQEYKNYEIILIDNASKDDIADKIKKFNNIKFIQNSKNQGFSGANNQGIRLSEGEYVFILNPDAFLTKDSISLLVECINKNKKTAFVTPKMLKPWDHSVIDTTGIITRYDRIFYDRGREEKDNCQYDKKTDIIAACGAAILFKKEALLDIRYKDEYLDEDFFAYLEDVDICWRLRLRGWKGSYCPDARIYHYRGHGLTKFGTTSLTAFVKKRKEEKTDNETYKKIRGFVFRNNIWIMIKNDSFFEIMRKGVPFIFSWTLRIGYRLLFEPYVFKETQTIISKLPIMLKKRRFIQNNKKISHKKLRKYFNR